MGGLRPVLTLDSVQVALPQYPPMDLLILDDNPKDIRVATDLGRRAGFSPIHTQTSSSVATASFANAIEDGEHLPDALVVDLDLGLESGFELLRFCHKNRLMPRMRVVVWSVMGDRERNVCQLFGVEEFVSKHGGPNELLAVLTRICSGNAA